MPVHAPNVNSYRRLFATWGAPRNLNWGIGNRSCSFRIPSTEEKSMRIENRISGSDTNPYLVIAANLAAGYLGIKNKLKPTRLRQKKVYLIIRKVIFQKIWRRQLVYLKQMMI